MINTAKVTDYRKLRFNTFAELRAELDAVERAAASGTLRLTGNWSLGQIFSHLAAFINYAFDGYPPNMRNPPLFIRLILKLMKNKFLHKNLPRGVKIPRIEGGTVGMDERPVPEALAIMRKALDRLEAGAPSQPNPIFGPMSHAEWQQMHLRHAELHLGYVHLK